MIGSFSIIAGALLLVNIFVMLGEERKSQLANTAFFRLMQGFLALGLLVGVSGLGIVMVRAVRERRRDIGVLRALGFQAGTIERAFLAESSFVALQGLVLGALLGVLTSRGTGSPRSRPSWA